MFELMFRVTSALPYYGNSGPGPKYLSQGDTDLGFFGTVAESDLGFFPAIMDDAAIAVGKRYYTDATTNVWLKFFYKGQVVYYPGFKTALVTYNALQAAKMTFDFRKKGTLDAPNTLPTGVAMWDLNPLYQAKDGNYLYVRTVDLKPSAASTTYNSAVDVTSEFYNIYLSVFSSSLTNPQGVKLPTSLVSGLYGVNTAAAVSCEANDASIASGIALNPTDGMFGKNTQAFSTQEGLFFPILQLVDEQDKARIPIPPKDLESWTDEINSRPNIWAQTDSLPAPYYLRAPADQTLMQPSVTTSQVYGLMLKSPHHQKVESDSVSIMSAVPPVITSAATTNFLKPTNSTMPTLSKPYRWIRKARHFPGTMQFQGAFFSMNATTIMVYSGMGKGGNTGVQYSGNVYTYNIATSTFGVAQSPGTWTWNSGVQIGNLVYLCDGHFDSAGTAGQLRRFNLASPATAYTMLAQGNGIPGRKTSVMCSIGTTKIFRFGGWNYSAASIQTTGGIYDIATNSWSYIAAAPEGRLFACAYHYNGKVYVVGGQTPSGAIASRIMIYTIATNTWEFAPGTLPPMTGYSEGQFYNGRYILPMTFRDVVHSTGFLVVNPDTLEYERVYTSEPVRYLFCANIVGDELFVAGGGGWLSGAGDWDNAAPACGAMTFRLSDIVP